MSQRIQLKRQSNSAATASGKVPTTAMLLDGELAINTVDGKLFLKKTTAAGVSSIVEVGANPFPTQTGKAGKFLTTNGTSVLWSTPGTVSSAAIDITQAAHGFAPGTILYHDGTSYKRARANSVATADVIGIVTSVATTDKFTLTTNGFVNMQGQPGWVDGAWVPGSTYYLSATTAGALTPTEPIAAGEINKPLLVAINSTAYAANDPNSGGPRGFFYNWRGICNDIPEDDVDNLLPPQSTATVGKSLTSGADGNAYWGAGGSTGGANASLVIQQTNHNLVVGQIVRYDGTLLKYVKSQANNGTNADVIGIISGVGSADEFTVTTQGMVTGLAGLTAGTSYFLSATVAGGITATVPTTLGHISKPVLMATNATSGVFVNMRGISISVLDTSKEVAPQNTHSGQYLTTNGTSTVWGTPVTLFNTRSGNITLSSTDVTDALGFTPYNVTNPSGYLTSGTGVASFNNRTGDVELLVGDITAAGGAPLSNPVFTGDPKAPTPAYGDNDTSIATTAFVQNEFSGRLLASSGYQTLPGGLIMQWGSVTIPALTGISFTFPIQFPNAVLSSQITKLGGAVDGEMVSVTNVTTTTAFVDNFPGNASTVVSLMFIGY